MNAVLETLEAMEAELHQEVYRELQGIPANVEDDYVDVRLQVLEDGACALHIGDASYDTDHSGFWGASSVSADDDEVTLMRTARVLVTEALEHAAQCGDST